MLTVTALGLNGHLGQAAPQSVLPAPGPAEQERRSRQGSARFLSTMGGGVLTQIRSRRKCVIMRNSVPEPLLESGAYGETGANAQLCAEEASGRRPGNAPTLSWRG